MLQPSLLAPWPTKTRDVLVALGELKLLQEDQLRALLDLPREEIRSMLADLTREGIVLRIPSRSLRCPNPPDGFALSKSGIVLATQVMEGYRPHTVDPRRASWILDHELALAEVAVVFRLLDREHILSLVHWETDRGRLNDAAWIVERARPVRVPLVADALAVFREQGRLTGVLIEVDRSTTPTTRMERKYKAFHAWWTEGSHVRRWGLTSLRIVTIAPTERRCEALRAAACRASKDQGSRLFWFATQDTFDLTRPTRIFDPVFAVAKVPDEPLQSLFPNRPPAVATRPDVSTPHPSQPLDGNDLLHGFGTREDSGAEGAFPI